MTLSKTVKVRRKLSNAGLWSAFVAFYDIQNKTENISSCIAIPVIKLYNWHKDIHI